jgi:hypothetical protein
MCNVKLADALGTKQDDTRKDKLMSLNTITALCRDRGKFKMGCQAKINVVDLFTNFYSVWVAKWNN